MQTELVFPDAYSEHFKLHHDVDVPADICCLIAFMSINISLLEVDGCSVYNVRG
jgi:hypothetical protein